MVAPHVSIVTLGVADVAASTSFYEALGLRRSSASNDAITFMRCGTIVLSLYNRSALAADAAVVDVGRSGFGGATMAMNLSTADEVDDVFAQWVSAGATALKSPQTVFWGGYSSYVADPDGHVWELAYNPYTTVGAEGRLDLSE
jgi:uncharacterized protein